MIHRRAALAAVLANIVLTGCSSHPTAPADHAQPLFLQAETFEPAPPGAAAYYSGDQPVSQDTPMPDEAASGDWAPIQDDAPGLADSQASQALALAMSSKDPATRASYLEAAAGQGSGQAHYELAKAYTSGDGRPRDLQLAQEHLTAAASLGDPEATRVIGWQMIKGQGGYQQNLNGGVAIMQIAVSKSVRTQRELGMLFSNLYSDYKLNDPVAGEAYLVQAYNAGDVPAAAALGKLYIQQGRQIDAVAPLAFASENNDRGAAKLLAQLDSESIQAEAPVLQANQEASSRSEAYYQQGIEIMLRKHSAHDEAKAYALLDLAAGMGHNLARAELAAIGGVKLMMDKQQGPGWLDAMKQEVQGSVGG